MERVVWHVVKDYSSKLDIEKLAPHDLRRSCARLCHMAGGEMEQIQFLLGHVSVETTDEVPGQQATDSWCRERLDRHRTLNRRRVQPGGLPTSMISLCQEGKGCADALRRSAGAYSFSSIDACVSLPAVVPIGSRTRLPFAVSAHPELHRRLSLCSPASPETYRREHRELALPGPVG